MLAAIDTDGRIFMALTTSNTTSEVICLFVSQLVELLEKEVPGFRENTVLQFDGATYPVSYTHLTLPTIYSV